MPEKLGEAVLELRTDQKKLEAGLKSAKGKAEGLVGSFKKIGKNLSTFVTLPIIGIGIASAKMATDLNAGMANIATLIPGNTERVLELKEAVQATAITVGSSTDDMAAGLFQLISAFGDTAASVDTLNISAIAAKAGQASLLETINLTSAVTKGYGDTSLTAQQKVLDLAFVTNRLGQTTFPELAASLGKVVPLSAALSITQEELFGVMATATGVTGDAAAVSTQLRGVLQSLLAPTADMTDLFEQMGVESGKALIEQEGLGGALEAITSAAEATGQPLQDFIGSIEGQTLAMSLSGTQADTLVEKTAAMSDAMGASLEAFGEQTGGVNAAGFAWDALQAKFAVGAQEIGDVLIPILSDLLTPVSELVTWFTDLDSGIQKGIIGFGALVAAIGPLLLGAALIPALIAGVTAVVVILSGPVGLIIGVVAVAALLTALIVTLGEVTGAFDAVRTAISFYAGEVHDTTDATDNAKKATENLFKVLKDKGLPVTKKGTKSWKEWNKELVAAGRNIGTAKTKVENLKGPVDNLSTSMGTLADKTGRVVRITADMKTNLENMTRKLEAGIRSTGRLLIKNQDLAPVLIDVRDAIEDGSLALFDADAFYNAQVNLLKNVVIPAHDEWILKLDQSKDTVSDVEAELDALGKKMGDPPELSAWSASFTTFSGSAIGALDELFNGVIGPGKFVDKMTDAFKNLGINMFKELTDQLIAPLFDALDSLVGNVLGKITGGLFGGDGGGGGLGDLFGGGGGSGSGSGGVGGFLGNFNIASFLGSALGGLLGGIFAPGVPKGIDTNVAKIQRELQFNFLPTFRHLEGLTFNIEAGIASLESQIRGFFRPGLQFIGERMIDSVSLSREIRDADIASLQFVGEQNSLLREIRDANINFGMNALVLMAAIRNKIPTSLGGGGGRNPGPAVPRVDPQGAQQFVAQFQAALRDNTGGIRAAIQRIVG